VKECLWQCPQKKAVVRVESAVNIKSYGGYIPLHNPILLYAAAISKSVSPGTRQRVSCPTFSKKKGIRELVVSKKCCLPVPFRYNSFTDNTLARIFTKNFTLFTRYPRITDSEVVTIKKNTQKIERKHLSLRTWCSRLVRKGIRFSKDPGMHKIVIALVINFWFFQRILW
jgi:hypothetical protein